MAPPEYHISLQRGIKGGFAPPTPNQIIQVTRASDTPNLIVAVQSREGGAGLTGSAPKEVAVAQAESLVDELVSILKDLPTEEPKGSEDIYGLNIGIFFGSEELQWNNSANQGCNPGTSINQPTPEQKAKFERAVAIVDELSKK